MDVPREVLKIFKCGECDEYLSCGPIYMLHKSGLTICGRCNKVSEAQQSMNAIVVHSDFTETDAAPSQTRNTLFEAAASLFLFPCRFEQYGCQETIRFTPEEPNRHETTCKYKPYVCPMEQNGQCDWIGPWDDLLGHCKEIHPQQILPNPGFLPRPNLSLSNLQTFIVTTFSKIFLLHVKVCLTTNTLYHCVRLLGNPLQAPFYQFLMIVDGQRKIKSPWKVLPAGCLAIQEHTSLKTGINSLLSILDGKFDGTKFSIKIIEMEECKYCRRIMKTGCADKCCSECKHKMKFCEFFSEGCAYKDTNKDKCAKHQLYFCRFRKKCPMFCCGAIIQEGTLFAHLKSPKCRLPALIANVGSVWRAEKSHCQHVILSSSSAADIHTNVFCSYKLITAQLVLHVWTALSSSELPQYRCSVEVSDPVTLYSEVLKPDICYNNSDDWTIHMKMDKFSSHNKEGVDIKVILTRSHQSTLTTS